MIQIIGLRPYTDKNGNEKKKHQLFCQYDSVPKLFKDLDSVIETVPDSERWNLYYSAAHCKDPKKGLRRFEKQDIIPFDIDGLDTERVDDYISVFFETTGLNRSKTGIVFSGNGLQLIVQPDITIGEPSYFKSLRSKYNGICGRINNALSRAGLPGTADTAVWDNARILRFPNTENRKPKGTTQAKLIFGNIEEQPWDWATLSGVPDVEKADAVEWLPGKTPKVDSKAVLQGCNYLQWVLNSPNEVREPQFYAALSVISRLENGHDIAHNIAGSIRDSGSDTSVATFSPSEIDQKIEQAVESSGPRTCENIQAIGGKCKECPYFGKITSPIQIKSEEFIATKETGFHRYHNKKPFPAYDDLIKYFDQLTPHRTLADNGLVYRFIDTHYELCSKNELYGFAEEHFNPKPKHSTRVEFEKKAASTGLIKTTFFESTINGFLNCQNGVLDIASGNLTPHSPDRGFRYCLPYSYDPTAKAPRFEQFLQEVTCGDKLLQDILQEYIGYAIAGGEYKIHKCLLLTGVGSNGKGVFINILSALAGKDNYSTVRLSDLGGENNRQLLEGKLFNISEEVGENELKDTGTLKLMTGNGEMLVKLMWHQPYHIKNRAKMVLTCNTLPNSRDDSKGFLRRFLIVPFDAEFTKDKIDIHLEDTLLNELPGILNYALIGYQRLMKNRRFTVSDKSDEVLSDYSAHNNIVRWWMEENEPVVVKPLNGRDTFVATEDLYGMFQEWALNKEEKHYLDITQFSKKITALLDNGRSRAGKRQKGGKQRRGYYDLLLRRIRKQSVICDASDYFEENGQEKPSSGQVADLTRTPQMLNDSEMI